MTLETSTTGSASLKRDGYAVVPALLDPTQVALCKRELSRLIQEAAPQGKHPRPPVAVELEPQASSTEFELRVRKVANLVEGDAFFSELLTYPTLTNVVLRELGTGARLLQSTALIKPPRIGSAKDWHQDVPYFPIEPKHECLALWVALDPATAENGCMQIVPGSHQRGVLPHTEGPTGWRLAPEQEAAIAKQGVSIELKAGDALLFHPLILHYTADNRSAHRRRALQIHFTSANTRWTRETDAERRLPTLESLTRKSGA